MALKEIFVLVAYLLCWANAYCTYDYDCGYSKSCCSDSVCRRSCSYSRYCVYDYQCGSGKCCSSNNKCSNCVLLRPGAIAGIVISTLMFVAIFVSIVACRCCACCPYYQYRHPRAVVVTSAPATGYNQFSVTTTSTQQCNQQPPAPGYAAQPPPYYPQQQAGPYPPPQGPAMDSYPPPEVEGPYAHRPSPLKQAWDQKTMK